MGKNARTKADGWFLQADIESRFKSLATLEEDFILVYESRDSYLEHLLSFALPISKRRMLASLPSSTWGYDFSASRGEIVKLRNPPVLSLKFRRYAQLRCFGDEYRDVRYEQVLAKSKNTQNEFMRAERLFVRRPLVEKFVVETSQCLLWCFRSERYSERRLQEFGLRATEEKFCTTERSVIRKFSGLSEVQGIKRPRMNSFSLLFGKAVVTLG